MNRGHEVGHKTSDDRQRAGQDTVREGEVYGDTTGAPGCMLTPDRPGEWHGTVHLQASF
jgi:hypothetical protein